MAEETLRVCQGEIGYLRFLEIPTINFQKNSAIEHTVAALSLNVDEGENKASTRILVWA